MRHQICRFCNVCTASRCTASLYVHVQTVTYDKVDLPLAQRDDLLYLHYRHINRQGKDKTQRRARAHVAAGTCDILSAPPATHPAQAYVALLVQALFTQTVSRQKAESRYTSHMIPISTFLILVSANKTKAYSSNTCPT